MDDETKVVVQEKFNLSVILLCFIFLLIPATRGILGCGVRYNSLWKFQF